MVLWWGYGAGVATPAAGGESGNGATRLGKAEPVSSLLSHPAATSPGKRARERWGDTLQGVKLWKETGSRHLRAKQGDLRLSLHVGGPGQFNEYMGNAKKKGQGRKVIPLSLRHHSTRGLFINLCFKSIVRSRGQLLYSKRSSRCSEVEGGSFTCSIQRFFF